MSEHLVGTPLAGALPIDPPAALPIPPLAPPAALPIPPLAPPAALPIPPLAPPAALPIPPLALPAALTAPKLLVQGVSKTYVAGRQRLETLASIDLTVNTGEFVTVIGPSGCGKSTLFNIVAGVDRPGVGVVAIDGDATNSRAGKSGYMPQQPLLLPWRTVEENVMLGLDIRHVPRKQALSQARDLLNRFSLMQFAHHYPATLSGGMRQRVALLRTVLFNSSFLLLDEPFGALDALTRLSLQMWLLDLWRTFHSSVLFITHDVREAILLSDRIYVLSSRPARVLRVVDVPLPRPRQQMSLVMQEAVLLEQELVAILIKEQGV